MSPTAVGQVYKLSGAQWQSRGRAGFSGGQPTGPGIVRYQDLSVSGDRLSQTLARLSTPSFVSFPAGVFGDPDFVDGSGKFMCLIPAICKGFLGSGIDQTIFRMPARTSTKVSSVPAQSTGSTNPLYLFRTATNPANGFIGSGFTIQGSEQAINSDTSRPHAFGGIMLDHVASPTMTDIKIHGVPGSSNTPPGETFGINDFGCTNPVYTRIEGDGRAPVTDLFFTAGDRVGASPLGCNDTVNVTQNDCYFHHSLASMPTYWQTNGVTTHNLRSEFNGSGTGLLGAHGINHERVSGAVRHYNPNIIINRPGGNTKLHMSLLSDQSDDTDIKIIAATFDASSGTFFHNCLSIQGNSTTYMGNPSLQLTRPKFYLADGVTLWNEYDGASLPGSYPDPPHSSIWYH